jgi:hypothetical protein
MRSASKASTAALRKASKAGTKSTCVADVVEAEFQASKANTAALSKASKARTESTCVADLVEAEVEHFEHLVVAQRQRYGLCISSSLLTYQ